jgi:hypothetical protein
MPTSEELLQELVDLKREEIKLHKQEKWLHFLFGTLPRLLFLAFMVYTAWAALMYLQEIPEMIGDEFSEQQEDLFDKLPELPF